MNHIQQLLSELELYGKSKIYKPHEFFIKENSFPKKIGIIKKGLFRYYYLTQEGKEFTKVFMSEGNIISSYSAMISGTSSFYNISAIEKSEVIEVNYDTWISLRAGNTKWDKLLISLLEKGYAIKEKREKDFLLLDAESRYKEFLLEYPKLEVRLRQHMIASYIGITPIALSRIRKKMII